MRGPPKVTKKVCSSTRFSLSEFFSEFYPDSGGYLLIFGPYPDSDIYLKKKSFWIFLLKNHVKSLLLAVLLFNLPKKEIGRKNTAEIFWCGLSYPGVGTVFRLSKILSEFSQKPSSKFYNFYPDKLVPQANILKFYPGSAHTPY